MPIGRHALAVVFCICATILHAQDPDVPPSPIPQDNGVGEPRPADTVGTPELDPESSQTPEDASSTEEMTGQSPEVSETEGVAEGPNEAAPGPDDWVTQPDTAPFVIGMPHEMQSDGSFRYTYPLDVPRYRTLAPELNLNYTSLGRPTDLGSRHRTGRNIR